MRQIAVLLGTASAAAGVLALPDDMIFSGGGTELPVTAVRTLPPLGRSPASAPGGTAAVKEQVLPQYLPPHLPDIRESNKAPIRAAGHEPEFRLAKTKSETIPLRAPANAPFSSSDPVAGFLAHSELSFCPEFSFLRIDGQSGSGAIAKLLSKMNWGGDFFWRQRWTEKSSSYLTAGFSRVDFQGATGGKAISQNGKTIGRIGLGATYSAGSRWQAGLGLALKQEIFYEHTGPASLRVDQVMVPRVEASVRYEFFKLNPFGLEAGLRTAYLFPSSANGYEIDSGSSHRFSLFLKEDEASGRLRPEGEVFYDWTRQNSSLHSKSAKELGLQIGLTWKFGQ